MVSVEGIVSYKVHNKNSQVSFRGHNLSSNDAGEKVYKFFIPKVYYDNADVIIKKFQLDRNGNPDTSSASDDIVVPIKKGTGFAEINPSDIGMTTNEVLGYKFVIDGKEYNDKHRLIHTPDGSTYNMADLLSTEVLQVPKSIYHIVPSSFNPQLKRTEFVNANEEAIIADEKTARMNHFMKFDTSLQDIIEKIPHIKEMGFRRILSTPIFGQDNLSSHGYWTNNPFQITSSYGTLDDFAKLQIELFKNSMGFIADGAFTNEGLTGIHIKDILRHGNRSPFKNWFEFFNYPASNIKLGVLPDSKRAYENLEIRVVNSPVVWSVDKSGKPTADFGKVNRGYDPEKETSIQIYDKRLTSMEQLKKDEVFKSYDIKNTQNPDDITDWTDSLRPYSFPVKASEVIAKAKLAKSDEFLLPKDYLLKWNNFELASAKDASGLLLWSGNKDIPKLRFVFPDLKKQTIYDNAPTTYDAEREIQKIETATNEVQNYIVSVGEFWTNKTAKILREYIVNELGDARTPEEFQRIISIKSGFTLPEAMKNLSLTQIGNALSDNYAASQMLQVPFDTTEALKEYPLEAIEVSDDLTTIFSYPEFKENFDSEIMPIAEKLTNLILNHLDSQNLPYGKFFENNIPTQNGMKTLQLISDDIMRFLILKSLNPELTIEDSISHKKVILEKIKNISALKMGIDSQNPSVASDTLLAIIRHNMTKISSADINLFTEQIKNKLKNVTPEKIKIADLIIDKSEAGLNWRMDAAKDIADTESFTEGEASANETWGAVAAFWKKFNDGVRLYNNHSYKIGEFTDTDIPYNETSSKIKNAGNIEQKIIEQSGYTTQSNYNYLFELLQRYYSAMPEYAQDIENKNAPELLWDKLIKGWEGVPGFLYSGNKNNIAFSHMAVGNHDKQRISHTLSLNSLLVYKNFWNEYGEVNWNEQLQKEVLEDLSKSHLDKSSIYPMLKNNDLYGIFDTISQRNLAKMASYTDAMGVALQVTETDSDTSDIILHEFTKALERLAIKGSEQEKNFFYKNFEATYEDILNIVKMTNPSAAEQIEEMQPVVHKALLEPARQRGIELAKLMVAMPGNPTLYAGDELLELGGEEKSKNFSFQNRNRLHWENLKSPDYSHVKEYRDKLSKIFNLRNDKNLTSLVTGDTILLGKQGKKGNREVVGMYRYNENDDAIILMHNVGQTAYRHFSAHEPVVLEKIELLANSGIENSGLPLSNSLPEGTKFVNALDNTQVFEVKSDGCLHFNNDKNYVMNDSVVILKRVKPE